jgi:hypothetical protein
MNWLIERNQLGNRGEGRAAASIRRPKLGKAAGLPPRGKVTPPSYPQRVPRQTHHGGENHPHRQPSGQLTNSFVPGATWKATYIPLPGRARLYAEVRSADTPPGVP